MLLPQCPHTRKRRRIRGAFCVWDSVIPGARRLLRLHCCPREITVRSACGIRPLEYPRHWGYLVGFVPATSDSSRKELENTSINLVSSRVWYNWWRSSVKEIMCETGGLSRVGAFSVNARWEDLQDFSAPAHLRRLHLRSQSRPTTDQNYYPTMPESKVEAQNSRNIENNWQAYLVQSQYAAGTIGPL
ncbi:hypothetical protein C8R43DRAFT_960375 [Mycena crocata]|nr:hypothetical protein C8R43DRAFT_960375 [Mycena crocata]